MAQLIRSTAYVVSVMLVSGMPAFAQETATPQRDIIAPADETSKTQSKLGAPVAAQTEVGQESLCLIIESAAKANGLPIEFFVRLIWQESRFEPKAEGPATRGGQRAKGIAQFMPATANERRLLDPFDPVQALPKSAEFLNELRNQFGNLGLAAAAYNAGPRRVQEWLAGSGGMPQETRNYVAAITGIGVDDWASVKNEKATDRASRTSCRELLVSLKNSPNPFVTQLENRITRAAAKPWGIQIAAGFNRDNALTMYAKAMNGLKSMIGRDPILIHAAGSSTFYHVLIGADTRREADELCGRMRREGGACLVKPNKLAGRQISRVRGHVARRVHARAERGPV
jgi:Transglycosylase SLT domain/SPOR domain